MEYDCEIVFKAWNFCIVRVGSFLVLLSKYGFSFSGNKEDWEDCLHDLKTADYNIQKKWDKLGLPADVEDSPGHDKLVVAAVECARANQVGWWE